MMQEDGQTSASGFGVGLCWLDGVEGLRSRASGSETVCDRNESVRGHAELQQERCTAAASIDINLMVPYFKCSYISNVAILSCDSNIPQNGMGSNQFRLIWEFLKIRSQNSRIIISSPKTWTPNA